MDPEQYERIFEKLTADENISDEVRHLVDAACSGDAELARLLDTPAGSTASPPARRPARAPIPGVTLRSIEVRGFRGIGPTARLDLQPGPGLTLVIGRNGSGKSSFAEALEVLLTEDCKRWSGKRTVDWQRGWRNIHTSERPLVRASFAVEGSTEVSVKRTWSGDALDSGTLEVLRDKQPVEGLAALGWEVGLASFRPFLSYAELATLVEEPSLLYDQLEGILGLEHVAAARKRLSEARKARERDKKATRTELDEILPQLALDDPRAQACRDALSKRKWNLDAVEQVLTGDTKSDAVAEVAILQRLSQLEPPPSNALIDAAETLRQARAAERDHQAEAAERADQLARLLEQAVTFHEHHAGPCPVCEQPLPERWMDRAWARIAESKQTAEAIRQARARVASATQALRTRIRNVPPDLRHAPDLGLGTEALELWQAWEAAPTDPDALIAHVEELALSLEEAVEKLRQAAASRHQRLYDAWQPIARILSAWLPKARRVAAEADLLANLKTADKWLQAVEGELRNERFEPIAERAQEIWEMLRQESSVSLQQVGLQKSGNRRKVQLDVTVDGVETIALAVVSQGELNALALSLFLPRMTLPETPFRFLLIDDPVQAMDPLKVDGLARVLADVARTRQVIVFTHDTRLPEAVRRLQIPADIIEVVRRSNSTVEPRRADDPVRRHLDDARALMHNEAELGLELTARIIPTFCRSAIETACIATIRRRRIGNGEPHASVDRALESAKGTNTLMAMALHDDPDKGNEVLTRLNNKLGRATTDAYQAIRSGAHGTWTGAYGELIRHAESIARYVESLA